MFKDDIILTLRKYHVTRKTLAKLAGISYVSLCFFLRGGDGKSIAERLIPFIYGDKREELESAVKK